MHHYDDDERALHFGFDSQGLGALGFSVVGPGGSAADSEAPPVIPDIDPQDFPPGEFPPGEIPPIIVDPPKGTTPGAVTVRPANWDLTQSPAIYTLASGDTLVGLATTYLGNGGRWREIWDIQPDSFKAKRTPDKIFVGDRLVMPDEATDEFKRRLQNPKVTPPGQKPVAPGTPRGGVPLSTGAKVGIAAGALALVGGIAYAAGAFD